MNQTILFVAKLALVAMVIIGGFVLAALGKIEPQTMFAQVSSLIGQLVIALGIASAGGSVAGEVRDRLGPRSNRAS